MKRISILGSGWLGLPLAIELQHQGYDIKASSRSETRLNEINRCRISAHQFDIESSKQDPSFLQADVLIINITSKNLDAYKRLITQIENSPIQKVLFISSTSVYKDSFDANAPAISEIDFHALKPCPLLTIEKLFQSSKQFKTSIIRFAGLIGYQRHPGRFFIKQQEDGSSTCKAIKNPEARVNMIHRDDCIGIIKELIQKSLWGEVFNGCSSHHPTRREFYTQAMLDILGQETVTMNFIDSKQTDHKVIANDKVMNLLSYQFIHNNLFDINYD